MLRIGEIAKGSHPVLARDIHIGINKRKLLFILRTLETHWKDGKPQLIKIAASTTKEQKQEANKNTCPFTILRQYVRIREPSENKNEPFFTFEGGVPIKPEQIRMVLTMLLNQLGFNGKHYFSMDCTWGELVTYCLWEFPLKPSKIRSLEI